MLCRMFFRFLSPERQMNCVRKTGVLVGNRKYNDYHVSVYMLNNFFVEITSDEQGIDHKQIRIFSNLNEFQEYIIVDSRSKMK